MNKILEARKIHKVFVGDSKIEVLKGIDIDLFKGESVTVLGKSGTGKSTLLQVLGTLMKPSSGEVTINGKNIFEYDEKKLSHFRNSQVGFVFQFHHLLKDFTSLENVMMPMRIAQKDEQQSIKKAKELLDQLGLSHRFSHKPSSLSGGEQQRVAVARAIANDPQLLIADEPTGNLDGVTTREVAQVLFDLVKDRGLSLLMASHNRELGKMTSRVFEMKDGLLHDA